MSAIPTTVSTTASTESTGRRHPLVIATVASGAIAAVATASAAAIADAAGVPLAIDGEAIPFLGFAQMTLIGAVLGGLMVAVVNRYSAQARQWFLRTAVVLTVLSCVPSVALPPDAATKIVLVATHLLAAAIVVPALARQTRR